MLNFPEEAIIWCHGSGLGGFAAFTRECFSEFPMLIDGVSHDAADDVVYINRALMLACAKGGDDVLHVPERLVYYRQGSGETSSGINYVKMQTRGCLFMLASAKQSLADLESIKQRLSEQKYQEFKKQYEHSLQHHQALRELWLGHSFAERKRGYDVLMVLRSYNPKFGKFMLLPRWITHSFLNAAFALNYRVKCWRRNCGIG